jgi:uncharacterized OsmC-like protein
MPIGDAVAAATTYLTDHPDDARYRDSAAIATLGEGLAVDVHGADGATLRTDMPPGIGGGGSAPSPGWYLRAAEAACVASLVGIRAGMLGIELRRVEVSVDSESDDRGILGMDDAIPAGPLSTRVVVVVDAADHREELDGLVRWAVAHCPVTDAVLRAVPLEVEVTVEGR